MSGSSSRAERPDRAFTLVELLVVVLILAILMAVALPLYLNAIHEAARRTARSNMHTLICAEVAYRTQKQSYTSNMNDLITTKQLDAPPIGPENLVYKVYASDTPDLPDTRKVQPDGVAACAVDKADATKAPYGCLIPGEDHE